MTYKQIEAHIKKTYGGNSAEFIRDMVPKMDNRVEHLNIKQEGMSLKDLLSSLIKG